MIVVDTNILAYSVLPGDHSELVRHLARRDPGWLAPRLWRVELRNVLVTAMRVRGLPIERALAAFEAAELLVEDARVESTTKECLEVAARGGVSAYDAEFVFAAERLDLLLVTGDRRLARAFPARARLLEEVAVER